MPPATPATSPTYRRCPTSTDGHAPASRSALRPREGPSRLALGHGLLIAGDPFFRPGLALEARDDDRVGARYLHLDTEAPVIVAEDRIGGAVVRMLVVHAPHYASAAAG